MPPETVWRYFGKPPGWAEQSQIEANEESPLQANLEEDLVIRIKHVDRPIVEAKAAKLNLIRDDATSDHWYIPADEAERIAKLNQIAEPSPWTQTERERLLWLLDGGGILVVATVSVACIWLQRRRSRQAQLFEAQVAQLLKELKG